MATRYDDARAVGEVAQQRKEDTNAGTERQSKKGGTGRQEEKEEREGERRGLLLIWSLITEGPRAAGPWDRYS